MFTLTASTAIAFALVVTISAMVQALTGFGFALCALSLLACWMDVREAAILLCPAGLMLNAMLFFRLRKHFRWNGLVPLLCASFVGLPFGTLLLLHTSSRILEAGLAGVMIFAALQGFVSGSSGGSARPWHPITAGIPCGFFGGVLSGAFGTGGPPIVSYLLNRKTDRFTYIASTQALLGIVSTVRMLQFLVLGRIDRTQAPVILLSFAAVGLGTVIGLKFLHRCSDVFARRAVLWFLVLGALGHAFRV